MSFAEGENSGAKPLTLISIVGTVGAEGDLYLHPPFPLLSDVALSRGPVDIQQAEGREVTLTEYAAAGEVLYRYSLPTFTLCSYPSGNRAFEAREVSMFTEVVPLPDKCTRLHIAAGPEQEIELRRSADAPVIRFEAGTPEVRDGSVHVKWSVEPRSASVLAVCIDESGRRPLGLFEGPGVLEVDREYIEGPTAVITLTVSADLRFASLDSEPFATGNASLRPEIISPIDGGEMERSEVDFFAKVPSRFQEVGADELEWFSSTDGFLGTGQFVSARLSPGAHDVVLRKRSPGHEEPEQYSVIRLVVGGERPDDQSGSGSSNHREGD